MHQRKCQQLIIKQRIDLGNYQRSDFKKYETVRSVTMQTHKRLGTGLHVLSTPLSFYTLVPKKTSKQQQELSLWTPLPTASSSFLLAHFFLCLGFIFSPFGINFQIWFQKRADIAESNNMPSHTLSVHLFFLVLLFFPPAASTQTSTALISRPLRKKPVIIILFILQWIVVKYKDSKATMNTITITQQQPGFPSVTTEQSSWRFPKDTNHRMQKISLSWHLQFPNFF